MKTGIVIDRAYMRHVTPPGHPERVERIETLLALNERLDRSGLVRLDARPAELAQIERNHDPAYVREVAATQEVDYHKFDADTRTCRATYETAMLAAGGCLTLADAIMAGEVDNGFAMVRPPGHHAEHAQAMGFCFFNNVAVVAEHLIARHGLERVLILDWDVHHGNGTEHSFFTRKDVMYGSLHQSPHYPGTGAVADVGSNGAEGYTVNVPLPAGYGDSEYLKAFDRVFAPIVQQFAPQFVLVSAGMDCHVRDPLADMRVSDAGIGLMMRHLVRWAREYSDGRCLAVLEGGYDLKGLESGAEATIDALGGRDLDEPIETSKATCNPVELAREIQSHFWKL